MSGVPGRRLAVGSGTVGGAATARRLMPPTSRVSGRMPVLVGAAALVVLLLPPAAVVAAAILAATLGARRHRTRRARRRLVDSQRLAAALETLVGELRVGAHPVTAFGVAAAECDGPVGNSLRAVAARARLGADVAAGLRAVAEVVVGARAVESARGVLAAGR